MSLGWGRGARVSAFLTRSKAPTTTASASAASTNQTEQQELTSSPSGIVKPQILKQDTGLNGLRPSMAASLNTKASCLLGRASATFCLGIIRLSKEMKSSSPQFGQNTVMLNCLVPRLSPLKLHNVSLLQRPIIPFGSREADFCTAYC